MRWLKEFFNPALFCERKGHDFKIVRGRVRKRDKDRISICVDYKADIRECKNCGKKELEKIVEYIEGYSSVTMPNSMWDELREKGYIIL